MFIFMRDLVPGTEILHGLHSCPRHVRAGARPHNPPDLTQICDISLAALTSKKNETKKTSSLR